MIRIDHIPGVHWLERLHDSAGFQVTLRVVHSLDRSAGELLKSAAALVDYRTYTGMADLFGEAAAKGYLVAKKESTFADEFPAFHAWVVHPHVEYEKVVRAAEQTYLNPAFWLDEPLQAFDSLVTAWGRNALTGALLASGFGGKIANGMTVREFAANTKQMVKAAGENILPPPTAVAVTPEGFQMTVYLPKGIDLRSIAGTPVSKTQPLLSVAAQGPPPQRKKIYRAGPKSDLAKFRNPGNKKRRRSEKTRNPLTDPLPDEKTKRHRYRLARYNPNDRMYMLMVEQDKFLLDQLTAKKTIEEIAAMDDLYYSKKGILFRLQVVPDHHPLAPFAKGRITDKSMAQALQKNNRNIRKAAKELGIQPDVLEERLLWVEKRSSPLRDFVPKD